MKKNLMFFVLGVSTTLLMGAGISYWNEIRQENKYGMLVNDLGSKSPFDYNYVPTENKHGVLVNDLGSKSIFDYNYVPMDNRYALVWGGEIGDDAKKAMVVGFIHGMAVGRKTAKEEAPNPNYRNQQNYPNFIRRY